MLMLCSIPLENLSNSVRIKSVASATTTKPSKDSQVSIVMVLQDSTKCKVEKSDDSFRPKRSHKEKGAGKGS